MHRVLRLRQALLSTIHQQKFLELESVKKQSVRHAIRDIEDKKFWKCLYILLHCVFPALRALRFCDASRPVMDKIFFLSHRTTEAIIRSQEVLNDPNLFGALKMDRNLQTEGNVILGGDSDDDEGEDVVFEVLYHHQGMKLLVMRKNQMQKTLQKQCHLVRQSLSTGTDARQKLNMHIQLQLGHCV